MCNSFNNCPSSHLYVNSIHGELNDKKCSPNTSRFLCDGWAPQQKRTRGSNEIILGLIYFIQSATKSPAANKATSHTWAQLILWNSFWFMIQALDRASNNLT